MDLKCPHCNKEVNIYIEVTNETSNQASISNFYFPKSWREFAGWRIADVEGVDPDYLDELLAQENPPIGGVLRKAIEFTVGQRKKTGNQIL